MISHRDHARKESIGARRVVSTKGRMMSCVIAASIHLLRSPCLCAEPLPEPAFQSSAARYWPAFRGNQASGVSDGQNLPTQWDGKKGVNIKWTLNSSALKGSMRAGEPLHPLLVALPFSRQRTLDAIRFHRTEQERRW